MLKSKIESKQVRAWSWIYVVVNTTDHFRINATVLRNDKSVLNSKANPSFQFAGRDAVNTISQSNIIQFKERGILYIVVAIDLLIHKVSIANRIGHIPEMLKRVKTIIERPYGLHVVINIVPDTQSG